MVAFHELPTLKARDIIKALSRASFVQHRQKGSHVILKHEDTGKRTVLPNHPRETISKALLTEIIEQAGLSIKEFLDFL